MTATRQYDAFGNITSASGSWQGWYGYADSLGAEEDPSGFVLYGGSLYDKSAGRYLTGPHYGGTQRLGQTRDGRAGRGNALNSQQRQILEKYRGLERSGRVPRGASELYRTDGRYRDFVHQYNKDDKISGGGRTNRDSPDDKFEETLSDAYYDYSVGREPREKNVDNPIGGPGFAPPIAVGPSPFYPEGDLVGTYTVGGGDWSLGMALAGAGMLLAAGAVIYFTGGAGTPIAAKLGLAGATMLAGAFVVGRHHSGQQNNYL